MRSDLWPEELWIEIWQEPASRQYTEAENKVMVFKETQIKNVKITDDKLSTDELAHFAERKQTLPQVKVAWYTLAAQTTNQIFFQKSC